MRLALPVLVALSATFAIPGQAASNRLFDANFDEPAEGPYSAPESARFLTQATYGATRTEVERLRQIGYNAWLNEQFAASQTLHLPYLDLRKSQGEDVYQDTRQEAWWNAAMGAPDQLRQRVAFALSEVLVVSDQASSVDDAFALANYYDILVRNAFGNYRTLLGEVTLSPVMGHYLSMFKNRKPDLTLNIRPDENYAREIMQLFSVGLWQLNQDGTRKLDASNAPIPTYTQDTIRGFAYVFTGWNWANCPRTGANGQPWEWEYCPSGPTGNEGAGWRLPMQAWENYHAVDGPNGPNFEKQLLDYSNVALPNGKLARGGTAMADLNAALDNVFNHPNVGPFLARRLIQRLVGSNPSPAYIGRVAAVFANNGSGVRGDLKATVKAILTDPEARWRGAPPANAGKLREPLLRQTQLWRALGASSNDGRFRYGWPDYSTGQAALRSKTVFNFFLPDYQLPGEIAGLGLYSPEFQLLTDTYITRTTNDMAGSVQWYYYGNTGLDPANHDIVVDLRPEVALAAKPETLVTRYDLLLMGGTMSTGMTKTLVDEMNSIGLTSWSGAPQERVTDALFLISASPEYVIEK